jgi:hypothetical protein
LIYNKFTVPYTTPAYFTPMNSNETLAGLSKKSQKKVIFKTVFDSPHYKWPSCEEIISKEILSRLLIDLGRLNTVKRLKSNDKTAAKRLKSNDNSTLSSILVGYNQVMRSLEGSEQLSIVFACKYDIENVQIFHHLQ